MAFIIPFSDFLNGGLNPNSLTARGSTAQNVNVTDLICEGPIRGLVNGEAGLHLDDVAVQDANFRSFTSYQPSGDNQQTFSGDITFSGSSVGTLSDELDISELELDENSPRSITLQNYKLTSVTVTNTVENAGLTTLTLSATSGTPFTTDWNSGEQLSGNAFAIVSLVQDDFSLSGFFFISNSSTAAIMVYGAVPPTTGTFTLVVDYTIPITALDSDNNQLTLAATPASGSYKFVIGAQVTASDNGEVTAGTSSVVSKIDKLNIDFRKGDLYQPVTTSTGGVGGAVAVSGNTSLISGPTELKIISQTLADSLGVTIFDKNGLPNISGSKDYPGNPDLSVMATSVTTLPSSSFGLDTAVKIKEADEIGFSIKYPALQVINLEKGDKETAYAFYVMQIRFEQNNSYGSWKTLFPGQEYVRHVGNTNAPVSFDHDINLEGYRKIVGPFEDFEVRVFRVTRHIGLPVRISGTNEDDTNKKKWQLSASASIENLRAVIKDHFTYPYSAVASVSYSSRQFDGVPKRSYLLEGKLVKVPSTYTPREYSDTGIAEYEGFWDGEFRDTLFYTDNPAWVFYDIVTNNRYGAGKWIQEADIDKYALYRVARYCDELVDDGSVYDSNSSFVIGELYKIKNAGDTSWSSIGSSSDSANTIFRATSTSITGTGTACRVEPRFRANVFLTKATDVYKVLKDFATIFLGILYWQDSKVVAVQDAPQDPVYNFTKGNVIDGAFSYESSGSRTRTNQVVVTWNDPTINYQPVPLVVEDRESIVRSGRIISENVVAFGATSESQAIRYGKWKLWTAQNQTELVSFKTSLAAHYIKPGDVINVQDADRFGISYSGRTSSATSTTLTFDRNVSFNSGSTYELSTLVTEPAALNASEGSITINSVTYERGEKIDQAYVYDGSSYELVDLNTEERASNAFSDSSGTNLIPTIWKPYTYVETHEITNPGNTTNTVTLANSVTFDTTPSKHNIWALKETSGNLNVAGSQKMYKVLSITEESPNTFGVSAVEYFDEKFVAVEEDYALGTIPETIYVEREPVTIPRPINPRVILATDAKKPGEELVLEWDQDESDSIVQYEVLHSIEGIDNPIKTKSRQVSFNNVPNGSVTFKVRAISRKGNISSYTAIDYGVYDPFGENVPRMAGGIPKGVISTAQGVIDSNNHFKFQATNASVASVTNPFVTYTISGTKNVSAISVDEPYYLYLDVATPSLKLLEYDSTALSNLQFYRDVGTGNAALSTAWTSIGTVSVAANSNEVTGSGFNNNVKLRDVLNLQNSTSPSGGDGAVVIGIISNTKLLIDRTFGTAKTNITGYRSAFRPDYANDSIFAEITKSGSTISTNNFITLRSQADEIEGTIETLDDGTIAVKDGGISVDKIAANSITADKIQANSINADKIAANSITTETLAANSITANNISANSITTEELAANSVNANTIAANSINSDMITANSVVSSLLTASTIQSSHIKSNSIVSTIIDATTINASDITTTTLSALTANMGDITAGTLKGGTIPDADASPSGTESGAFMDLTGGKMVFGTASKHVLFDGTDLILSGVTIDANSIVNATAAADIEVKEDGTSEGTGIASFNFTTGLNLSVNGTEATLSANDQTPSWVPAADPSYLTGITTAQVRTAGALMDDELTDLAGVKGVTISTLQPKPSEGAFENGDKTKLDNIEDNAKDDQTKADINALQITQVGTVTSGAWQGDPIADAYLSSNTAHLSGTQTFTGIKTFGNIRSDIYSSSSFSSNSFLDFDDDNGSIGTNSTTLGSVASIDFIVDTNNNGTGDSFVWGRDATNADAANYTELMKLDNSGNLTLLGTVDGADVAGMSTKLSTIEDDADVTDTANVRTAGALMDDELTDLAGVKAVTISTLQPKPSEGAFVDGDKTKLDDIEESADVTDTVNVVAALTAGDNITIDADGTITATDTKRSYEEIRDVAGGLFDHNLHTEITAVDDDANNRVTLALNTAGPGAATYGSTANGTKIDTITLDAYGRVTDVATGATGDILGVTAGTGLTGGGTSGSVTLNVSGLTTSEIAAGSLIIAGETFEDSDIRLMSASAINDRIESFQYTTNLGDITNVSAGTGLTGGGTSGSVTLNVSGLTTSEIATGSLLTGGATFENDDVHLMTAAAVEDKILSYNYTGNTGDITNVSAGTGLTGGGATGSVSLSVNTGAVTDGATTIPTGDHVYDFVTDFGYTTNIGDITGVTVTAGSGMTGGGSATTGNYNKTLNVIGGDGITANENDIQVDSSVVRTTGAQTIAGNKTFSDNVTVTGNFTVNGTSTTINTATLTVEDNIIVVNSGQAGTPANTVTAGIEVERGDSANKRLVYAETGIGPNSNLDGWSFGSERVQAGTFYGTFVGDVTGTPSSLAGLTTDNLTEGTNNLYFTTSRVIGALSGGSGIDKSASGEFAVDNTVIRTSGNQTLGGVKTFTSAVKIHNGGPVIELKDTTDNDDHHIYFKDSNDSVVYSIDTQNATSGDALTLSSSAQEIVHRIGTENIFESHASIVKSLKNFDVTGTITASSTITATGGNSTNWNTAYGWDNHANAGYLTAVPAKASPVTSTELGAVNLDDYAQQGDAGFYHQLANADATNGSNWPNNRAGSLLVQKGANLGGYGTTQLFIDYSTSDVYVRSMYGSNAANTAWVKLYDTSDFTNNSTNWNTAYANSITSASFDDSNGIITLTQQDSGTVTVDIDGRFLTSETSHADVVVDGDFTSAGLMKRGASAGSYSIVADNSSNWDTAYSWDDHSTQGYLTSLGTAIVDGDFGTAGLMTTNGSGSYSVTTNNSSNWNTAFGWGNHANGGYITTVTAGTGLSGGATSDAATVNIADETLQALARGFGWEPTYAATSTTIAEDSVYWDLTEKCLVITGDYDSSIGAAFRAVRVKSGETIRFTVTIKASAADSDGVYLRLYQHNGNMPDGKTHVSSSSANGSPFVQEDDSGDTGWYENGAAPAAWTTFERDYTPSADGYVSLVILNWNGMGNKELYVRQPDITKIGLTLGTSATTALAGNTPLLQIGTTSTTALAGNTPLLQLGTTSTTALAGNTPLLQLGTTATTALAGNTALFDGDYNSLTNKPSLLQIGTTATTALAGNTALFDGNYNSLTNKPALFDGNYNSLTNKPSLLQLGTTATTALAGNTALFDGDYNSLTNKPSLLQIGTTATTALAGNTALFDGDYNSLTNKPSLLQIGTTATTALAGNTSLLQIGTTATTALAGNTALFDGDYNSLTNKPSLLQIGTTATTALAGNTALFDGDYNSLTNKPTLFDGTFNSLTSKTSGTGDYSTSGYLTAGRGSGGVSLTHNDGYGNANVTFNHKQGVPEQAGNCGRIVVNTDSTTGALMSFELLSNNATNAVNTPSAMEVREDNVRIPGSLMHLGDTDTYLKFDTDRIRLYAGGVNFLDISESTSDTINFKNAPLQMGGTTFLDTSRQGFLAKLNVGGTRTDSVFAVTSGDAGGFEINPKAGTDNEVRLNAYDRSASAYRPLVIQATKLKLNIGSDTYTFPTADGLNGQVITTDGNGTLTFADASGGTDLTALTDMTQSTVTNQDEFVLLDNGSPKRKLIDEVISEASILTGTQTGSLLADVLTANVISADMIQANSIVATIIDAETITAQHIEVATTSGAGIYMELVSGNGVIRINDGSNDRVKIGYLGT